MITAGTRCVALLALALASSLALAGALRAGEPVPIGSPIDGLTFTDIRSLERSLDELGRPRATVLVFTTTTCPLVQRYLPRLNELQERFAPRDIHFLAVNVGPADTVRAMASQALAAGASYPFVKDRTGACASAVGVDRTPGVAVLDGERRLVYRGRIDDQYRIGGTLPRPRRDDLREALEDVLAGRPVRVPETAVDGCRITAPSAALPPAAGSTYHGDVAPLLARHCVRCHAPGGGAPFALESYRQVHGHGAMIAEVVADRRMPPWYASPDHGTFQNDRSLSPAEIATIVDWVRTGMAEGEPAAPQRQPAADRGPATSQSRPPAGSGWSIGEPDLVLTMLGEHELPADGFVPYRYVVLPHVFLRETWIAAFEIRPDNRRVVHHANLGYAAPGAEPGQATFITGYVPGGQALDLGHFEGDVAFRLPALSVLGLQIHYVTTGRPERCRLSVGIRFHQGVVRKRLRHHLADPRRFRIPPHHPAYPVRDAFTLEHDASLLGLFAHMHLRGRDMTFLAHRPDGSSEILLEIPNFSFDWQLGYEIAPGVKTLPAGTRIEVVAHFDNSAFNPHNPDPDQTVRYGPQTVDEMMNGYVFYIVEDEQLALAIDPANGTVRGTAEDVDPEKRDPQQGDAGAEPPATGDRKPGKIVAF